METRLLTGVVNSTNAEISQDVRVHVQTEIVERSSLVVTCVMHKGYCCHRAERSYKPLLNKSNLEEVLLQAASAMHRQVLQRLPRIWEDLTPEQLQCIRSMENRRSEHPLDIMASDVHDIAMELFERGLAAYREEPSKALELWNQALELEPTNRSCRANIKRLSSIMREKCPEPRTNAK